MPNAFVEFESLSEIPDECRGIQECLKVLVEICIPKLLVNIIDETYSVEGRHGTWQTLVVHIEGDNAYDFLRENLNKFNSQQPHAVTVQVYKEISDEELSINASDLLSRFYRRDDVSNAFVHHTDCNVELIHNPTGLVVRCQSHRNRIQNNTIAAAYLRSKLALNIHKSLAKNSKAQL